MRNDMSLRCDVLVCPPMWVPPGGQTWKPALERCPVGKIPSLHGAKPAGLASAAKATKVNGRKEATGRNLIPLLLPTCNPCTIEA